MGEKNLNQSEHDLIKDIIKGDSDKYRIIVNSYKEMIYYLGLKFFYNPVDAEDFSQELFIRAYRKLGSYRGKGSFKGWLYRMAYNLAVNTYHAAKRRKTDGVVEETMEAPLPEPDTIALDKLYRAAVEKAMGELPNTCQLVFKLCFYDGFSYPETARITGIPVNTVKSYVFRGRKLLKRKLAAYE